MGSLHSTECDRYLRIGGILVVSSAFVHAVVIVIVIVNMLYRNDLSKLDLLLELTRA